jgi:hypothetical protein
MVEVDLDALSLGALWLDVNHPQAAGVRGPCVVVVMWSPDVRWTFAGAAYWCPMHLYGAERLSDGM